MALLLHAASGEGGEDGDVRAHVTCEGTVVMSFGVGEAAFEGSRSSSLAESGYSKGGARDCIVAGEYLADPVEK